MTEEEILTDNGYLRATWALDHQFHTVEHLKQFWKLFGKVRVKYPDLELHPNWDML